MRKKVSHSRENQRPRGGRERWRRKPRLTRHRNFISPGARLTRERARRENDLAACSFYAITELLYRGMESCEKKMEIDGRIVRAALARFTPDRAIFCGDARDSPFLLSRRVSRTDPLDFAKTAPVHPDRVRERARSALLLHFAPLRLARRCCWSS